MSGISSVLRKSDFSLSDWGSYAVWYDSLLHLRPYITMLREVGNLIKHQRRGGVVLDASCGTGNFEKVFCEEQSYDDIHFVGIDSSKEMLDRAREKCSRWNNVTLQESDLDSPLHFRSETFDQIVSINTLYAVTSPDVTLQEFFRVLKPDGRLVIVTPKHGFENGLILKEHCGSSLPDSFWYHAHGNEMKEETLIRAAIDDECVVQQMLSVARYNRKIASNRMFHFFSPEDLKQRLKDLRFTLETISYTYAEQALLISAIKT